MTLATDTLVAGRARHRGIGTALVAAAAEHASAAGCEWLHVDFEDHLAAFYYQACGFTATNAGLIALPLAPATRIPPDPPAGGITCQPPRSALLAGMLVA